MKRRTYLKKTLSAGIGIALVGSTIDASALTGKTPLRTKRERIAKRIGELARFGRNEKGQGYRVAFTQGDIEGRKWFMDLMNQAGLSPSIDAAGNIIGKRKGKNNSLKPIAFGSHIDMVPDGGNYDGTLGSLAALEVIEVLNENNIVTEHPLEVIIFANEEGGLIGSRGMAGLLNNDALAQISQSGLTMAEGIKAVGGDPENISAAKKQKGDYHAFLELHIEQGGILENENLQIGLVEGIVGILDCKVTVIGFANHAGTTPMKLRKDALLAASKLTVAVNEVVTSIPGNQVGTVGKITANPGAYNVVPGEVTLGLELRDLSWKKIEMLFATIQEKARLIEVETSTQISFEREANFNLPALTDKQLQETIKESATSMGLSTKYMQSGAGHDTQQMSTIAPVAMIFVPSAGGISHSPKEFTKDEDMENGANVLLQTILMVDSKSSGKKSKSK